MRSFIPEPARTWLQAGGTILLSVPFLLFHPACRKYAPSPEEGGGETFFPHPSDFSDPLIHGDFFMESSANCQNACHGDDFMGGFTDVSCFTCHEHYPHTTLWSGEREHGIVHMEDPDNSPCRTFCHGEDLAGGGSGVACTACHPSYPHPSGWEEPSSHGAYTISRGTASICGSSCHGEDYSGGDSGISCLECHPLYPHPPDFNSPGVHSEAVDSAGGNQACATLCHGADYAGGDSQVACFQCHNGYPHHGEWIKEHMGWVQGAGDSSCAGSSGLCHSGGGGGRLPQSCTTLCHNQGGS